MINYLKIITTKIINNKKLFFIIFFFNYLISILILKLISELDINVSILNIEVLVTSFLKATFSTLFIVICIPYIKEHFIIFSKKKIDSKPNYLFGLFVVKEKKKRNLIRYITFFFFINLIIIRFIFIEYYYYNFIFKIINNNIIVCEKKIVVMSALFYLLIFIFFINEVMFDFNLYLKERFCNEYLQVESFIINKNLNKNSVQVKDPIFINNKHMIKRHMNSLKILGSAVAKLAGTRAAESTVQLSEQVIQEAPKMGQQGSKMLGKAIISGVTLGAVGMVADLFNNQPGNTSQTQGFIDMYQRGHSAPTRTTVSDYDLGVQNGHIHPDDDVRQDHNICQLDATKVSQKLSPHSSDGTIHTYRKEFAIKPTPIEIEVPEPKGK